ncbi:hypothetical protein DL96DRAFT_1795512 [Flagelloscypha sp. PMI_526]|nr:hypothetical protein DL96DRAFT_1795512 [Flagelloscypha sp. PMI_526]
MDATELARWTRFASKGGIGTCTAVEDCIAETPEDLMFLKGDEIVVLFQEAESYLGFCEGVVGRFEGSRVRFHAKLKRPVMTKRSSMAAKSPQPSPVPPSPSLGRMSSFTTNESLALKTPPLEPLSSPESPDTARPWAHSKTPSATSVSSFGQHARFLTSSSSSSAASNSISQLSQGPLNGGVLPRGSLASLPEQQQRNTVLSTVSSEGDENAGIGFNFLQAGSDDSDDDDDLPQRQRTHTGSSSTSSQYARASIERPRPESPPQPVKDLIRNRLFNPLLLYLLYKSYQERRLSPPPTIEELLVQRRERGSPSSTSTPNGTQGGGYFDIYDDYRYSRASSIATNATRERARSGSIASSIASSLRKMNEEIPPVPDARPSLDSQA